MGLPEKLRSNLIAIHGGVYTDATIAFPILALYALANEEPREPKRIYKNLGKYYETLQESAIKIPEKFAEILKKSDISVD